MAIPTPLRYWLIRLRAFNQPLLWCSGLAVVLLAIVYHEHQLHPEWLGRFEVDSNSPGQPGQNSTLTPEEQGSIADIDNLSTLYSDLGINPVVPDQDSSQAASASAPKDLLSLLRAQSSPPGQAAASSQAKGTSASPFASYLDQYRFLGGSSPQLGNSTASGVQTPSLLGSPSLGQASLGTPSLSSSAQPPSTLGISSLQQALQQQYGAQNNQGTGQSSTTADLANSRTSSSSSTNGLPPAVLPATLPGSNLTFLRTTPQMSPPPGTTGYVPPATLSSPNPYSLSPTSPLPGTSGVTPNFSPVTPNQGFNLNGPGSSGSSTVLPPATGSVYTPPPSTPLPTQPFSVQRPPGSHIGGGYVYTFSDPNGPSN